MSVRQTHRLWGSGPTIRRAPVSVKPRSLGLLPEAEDLAKQPKARSLAFLSGPNIRYRAQHSSISHITRKWDRHCRMSETRGSPNPLTGRRCALDLLAYMRSYKAGSLYRNTVGLYTL